MIEKDLREISVIVDQKIQTIISNKKFVPDRLLKAIKYSTYGLGKKIRPFLVFESLKICSDKINSKILESTLLVATAVELIHTYSLIHDDLPSMDNSDLRRGKASLHKAFDEATAILVGDALQTLAFEILSDPQYIKSSEIRSSLCFELSKSIGFSGMVGGQMYDLISENRFEKVSIKENDIYLIQRLKTGALIKFSMFAGATMGNANSNQISQLIKFSENIGIAFQIKDDLLDIDAIEGQLGKPKNSDQKSGKYNFINLLGYNECKRKLSEIILDAKNDIRVFKDKNKNLLDFTDYVEKREK